MKKLILTLFSLILILFSVPAFTELDRPYYGYLYPGKVVLVLDRVEKKDGKAYVLVRDEEGKMFWVPEKAVMYKEKKKQRKR